MVFERKKTNHSNKIKPRKTVKEDIPATITLVLETNAGAINVPPYKNSTKKIPNRATPENHKIFRRKFP